MPAFQRIHLKCDRLNGDEIRSASRAKNMYETHLFKGFHIGLIFRINIEILTQGGARSFKLLYNC